MKKFVAIVAAATVGFLAWQFVRFGRWQDKDTAWHAEQAAIDRELAKFPANRRP